MGSVITVVRLSLRVQKGMWWRDRLPCGFLTSGPYRNTDTRGDAHIERENSPGIVIICLSLVLSLHLFSRLTWMSVQLHTAMFISSSEQFQPDGLWLGCLWVSNGQRGLSLSITKLLAFEFAKNGMVQHLEYSHCHFHTCWVVQELLIKVKAQSIELLTVGFLVFPTPKTHFLKWGLIYFKTQNQTLILVLFL